MATGQIGAVIVRKGRCKEDGYTEPYARLDDGREEPMGWNRSGPIFEVGTRGTASFVSTPSAGLWRFEPEEPFVTGDEVAAINAARRALEAIRDRATSRAWNAPSSAHAKPTAQNLGRLAGVADVAADVLFDVLNTASSRGIAALTETEMILRSAEEEEPES